ncbi:MAG: imidazole glycerol phosphate synthase subunit HisH [Acidobacteriaceae bacterium]
MPVTIIDYKAGNIASVVKAFQHLGAETIVTSAAPDIATADSLVLPGVGHFSATRALDSVRTPILERIRVGVPFLGICVGMQWLYESSDEDSGTFGLGVLKNNVQRFPATVKSPHVGWNIVARTAASSRLLQNTGDDYAYFTHSYFCPITPESTGTTEYGGTFASAAEVGNVFGVQFHVEKSGATGLQILRNFLSLAHAH